MKADCIIKNAKIFTADRERPQASALAVKDGKFVYVGDDAGLSEYEGEVRDLGGSKQGALDFMADFMTAEHEGFSFNKPRDVYFGGKKMTIAGPAPRK